MKPDISEFSYGYALTEDLIRTIPAPLRAAPVFPSLIEEGKSSGGYDLQLDFGVPLFLQFKLSDYMKHARAVETSKYHLFNPPFFRMHLRPRKYSKQHNSLLSLEQTGQLVFYAAPAFHTVSELNQYYLREEVAQHSVFFRPSDIGPLPDDKNHHVAFKISHFGLPLRGVAYRLSKPEPMSISSNNEIMMELKHKIYELREKTDLKELKFLMTAIIRKHYRDEYLGPIDKFSNSPLMAVAYLARTYFQSEMLWISPRSG